jgi:type 1 fimbriae regulatory protein FimB/type 1 fimbriae regulatory protein FimE
MAPELRESRSPTPPRRTKIEDRRSGSWNLERRPGGEWLPADDIKALRKAALAVGRHGARDSLMILEGYVHGLRVSELVRLRIAQYNLKNHTVMIYRSKGSTDGTHPLTDEEVRLISKFTKDRDPKGYLFVTEKKDPFGNPMLSPLSPSGFTKILARAADRAGLKVSVHPHMLRHSCGYALANAGRDIRLIQDWMGHKNIQNTVGYTALSADRFKGNFFPG